MKLETITAGLMLGALLAVGGCSYHEGGPGGPEAVQAGYAVDDPYYDQGAYQGDYWVWHDREGHVHREARADHERRAGLPAQHGQNNADRRGAAEANRAPQRQAAHGDARQGMASRGPANTGHAEGAAEGHAGDAAAASHGGDESGGDHR